MSVNSSSEKRSNFAFISYRRSDVRWAIRVQKRLESYRLPAVVRSEADVKTPYLRPVFRDGTDLAGGVLIDQLRNELLDSRWLIVICSPEATKSEWVNKEIQTFIDAGRADRIIPFVVAGTPRAADPADEAFPPALLALPPEHELLGINVSEVGWERAFIRLVATMLGIRFDTLWQRHRRRVRRNRIIAAVTALIVLAGVALFYDYKRPVYEYYDSYSDCNGLPKGIIPLTKEQVARRSGSLRFTYRRAPIGQKDAWKRRLTSVEFINSDGYVRDDMGTYATTETYPVIKIDYSPESGLVTRLNYCNRAGKVQLRYLLSDRNGTRAAVADLIHAREQLGSGYGAGILSSMGKTEGDDEKSSIVRYVFERDSRGFITSQTFHANNDPRLERSAVPDPDGIFGYRFTVDSLGRRTSVTYVGADGEPVANKKGVARMSYSYAPSGGMDRIDCFDLDGNLTLNEELWATLKLEYDEKGCDNFLSFYGPDGNPVCNKEEAIAGQRRVRDEKGYITEATFVDTEGKPCMARSGYSTHRLAYDSRGNMTSAEFFDAEGRPVTNKTGEHRYEFRYDKRGNRTYSANYGLDGSRVCGTDGVWASELEYDDDNNVIRQSSYGLDGKLLPPETGVAVVRTVYDESSNPVEQINLDPDGNFVEENGVARMVSTYDDRGNRTSFAFFDKNNAPTYVNGISSAKCEYDENGHCTILSFFDAEGNPTPDKEGVARYECSYTPQGKKARFTYYGPDGKITYKADGTAGYYNIYDAWGNNIETVNVDETGARIADSDGEAIVTRRYDSRRNIVNYSYFDADSVPLNNAEGVHQHIYEFDDRGNMILAYSLDCNGALVADESGALKTVQIFNDRGECVRVENRDADNRLAWLNDGYTAMEIDYDRLGNPVERRVYDTNNRLVTSRIGVAINRSEYDARGRNTADYSLDPDGNPAMNIYGYSIQRIDYADSPDSSVMTVFFLLPDGTVRPPEGSAISGTRIYNDSRGRKYKEEYLAADSSLYYAGNNYCTITYSYDAYGNILRTTFLNADVEPVAGPEGAAVYVRKYNSTGKCIEVTNLDPEGNPTLGTIGYATQKIDYDRYGRPVKIAYFGTDGEPVAVYGGYHVEERSYSPVGEITSHEYFDTEGKSLANYIDMPLIVAVNNKYLVGKLKVNSCIVRCGNWTVGDPVIKLRAQPVDVDRTLIVLTPDGNLESFIVPQGNTGLRIVSNFVPKEQVEAIKARL